MGVSERRPYHRSPQLERALELLASARDEARRRLDLDGNSVVDKTRWLAFRLPCDADLALHDEGLRPRAALSEGTLNENHVETALHGGGTAT